jgi:hypothetical protein
VTFRDGTPDPALRHTENRLREHLVRAQADRGRRGEHNVTGYDQMDRPINEPAWRVHERNLMFTLVNQYRGDRGLNPVQMREVRMVEDALAGRADYTQRLVEVLARSAHGLPDDHLLPADPGPPEDYGDGPWGDTHLSLGAAARVVAAMAAVMVVLLSVLAVVQSVSH